MKQKPGFSGLIICLLVILASSCNILKPYQSPALKSQVAYRNSDPADTVSIAQMHWKEVFTDTLLQQLITEGISQNLDLQTAYSRVRQAQAYYEQSRLAFFPSLGANATAIAATSSNAAELGKTTLPYQYQTTLVSSWEADIWGKLRSAKKANLASLLAAEANARAIKTMLISNIADEYYTLLGLQQQLLVTEQSVKNWQITVDVMKELKKADVVTSAAIVQSEASKYAVAVTLPDLKQSIYVAENQLNFLLGKSPGPIQTSTLENQRSITLLKTGVPVQLLANRPDVQAAEYNFQYYFQMTNVARAYFYPALTINASGGFGSLTSFFGAGSWISSLTAGLAQPIFSQGANRTRLHVSLEQQQQAALAFKSTLLTAGQEVSNAMYSYQTASEKMITRKSQLENLEKSVDYTQELVRYGFANYTEVLTAQQNLLSAQLNKVNDRLQQLHAIVYLYRSLGGGWK